ncbi:hypothetical protein IH982_03085 [Patescibacteria group bacterium]|nr:hypothetical protein [Patescibacteria group bacterium]
MKAFLRFSKGHPKLSPQERKVVQKLTEAAKIISSLYLMQKNPRYLGANFYPHDATKKEIQEAAKNNPDILSPYTFVERKKGKLIAVFYHVKFKKEVGQIAKLLREAAALSSDKKLKAYLKARAEDFLKDNYDKSNILWLQTEYSKIGVVIGPFDRYLDQLFFKKRAYMAWVGVLDEKTTNDMTAFKELILTSERIYLPGSKRVKISQVKVRIEDTLLFSGLVADFVFVGNNLPSSADTSLIKKYGTIFTVFEPTLAWRFEQSVLPIFRRVFAPAVQQKYSSEEIKKAFLQISVLHEACHSLMRYEDAPARLEELFPYFDELFTNLLGIKGCGALILKNALTERELELITLVAICQSLYFYASLQERPHIKAYATGGALMLEFLQKGKALSKRPDGFHFDPYRALIALNQLTSIIEYYIALGNHNEAEEFLKKFPLGRIFSPFKPYLKGIPRKKILLLTKKKSDIK